MTTGSIAIREIEAQRKNLEEAALKIWENPEGPNKEFFASKLCADMLEAEGFQVEWGIGGLKTAIRASWGSGKPVIGYLGEYDALPELSQKVSTKKEAVCEGAYGQGCGHNLLGIAHVGGAIGLKRELEQRGLPGTVVFYGCPAEETLCGKPFMARGGAFKELDAAIAFHPSRFNRAMANHMTGVYSVKFHFKGKTAHAGGDAYNGRSALDAVEITNVGANYLREHVTPDVRLHYVITEGGTAPNVVPANACVWYFIRALTKESLTDTYNRLCDVAKGAAMITGTKVEIEFLAACYPTNFNRVMAEVADETLREIPQEAYTEEEIAFAHELNLVDPVQWEKACYMYGKEPGTDLFTGVMPIGTSDVFGSTDVSDVSHIVPTNFFYTNCYNIGAPGHSWQVVSCAGRSIGLKGMIYASKVMAVEALKLMENPELLQKAKDEFQKTTKGQPYTCLIPDDVPAPQ